MIVSYGEDGEPVSVEVLNAWERNLVQKGAVDVSFHTGEPARAGSGGT